MKKFLMTLIAIIGICVSVFAQSKASGNFFGKCGDGSYLSINLYSDGSCTYNRSGVKGEGTYQWRARMYEGSITLTITMSISKKTVTITGTTTNNGNVELKTIKLSDCGILQKQ